VKTWEERCYPSGIPDEVPEGLSKSLRAPSYKSICLCILRNDLILKGLGFGGVESKYHNALKESMKESQSRQNRLF